MTNSAILNGLLSMLYGIWKILFDVIGCRIFNIFASIDVMNELNASRRKRVFEAAKFAIEKGDTDCPICYSCLEDPILLKCRHVFCEECLFSWLGGAFGTGQRMECPLCTAEILDSIWLEAKPLYWNGATSGNIVIY